MAKKQTVKQTKMQGKVTLKNTYKVVLDSAGNYRVSHKTPRGALFSQDVSSKVVDYVYKRFRGTTVTVEDVEVSLKHAPKTLHLPYEYGYQLQYFAQCALVILVAMQRATHLQHGKRFDYTILGTTNVQRRTRRKPGVARRQTARSNGQRST